MLLFSQNVVDIVDVVLTDLMDGELRRFKWPAIAERIERIGDQTPEGHIVKIEEGAMKNCQGVHNGGNVDTAQDGRMSRVCKGAILGR